MPQDGPSDQEFDPAESPRSRLPRAPACRHDPRMEIRVWRSFSCNNSSDYYLVASFDSPAKAAEVAAELAPLLAAHAKQKDKMFQDDVRWDAPSPIQVDTAKKYGFDWNEYLGWGDGGLAGDEPSVAVNGSDVVLYHSYCGGLDAVGTYLTGRGGTVSSEEQGCPTLAVRFQLAPGAAGKTAHRELSEFFSQGESSYETSDWKNRGPWKGKHRLPYAEVSEQVFWWCDGASGGFSLPFDIGDLGALRTYLGGKGFADYRISLSDEELPRKLKILGKIDKCPECKSTELKLFEADDSMPEDQIACGSCGGMFSLSTMAQYLPEQELGDGSERFLGMSAFGETCYASGWYGSIWKRTAGKWEQVRNAKGQFAGILALSADHAIVCGDGGVIAETKNGGKTWRNQKSGVKERLWKIRKMPGGSLLACGDKGVVLRTDDLGKNWTALKSPATADVMDVCPATDDVFYACTRTGAVYKTVNAGKTWKPTKTDVQTPLCRIAALDAKNIVVVGDGNTVLTSKNGGETWVKRKPKAQGDIEDVSVGNDGRLYAVNGRAQLLISADKGAKWQVQSLKTTAHLWRVVPTPSGDLVCAGDGGTIYRIEDVDAPAQPAAAEEAAPALDLPTKGKSFVFTGKLAAMTRAEATAKVEALGGVAKGAVTKTLDYLVIGDDGSPLYGGGKKGSKQVAAEKLIAAGAPTRIISEADFKRLEKR